MFTVLITFLQWATFTFWISYPPTPLGVQHYNRINIFLTSVRLNQADGGEGGGRIEVEEGSDRQGLFVITVQTAMVLLYMAICNGS